MTFSDITASYSEEVAGLAQAYSAARQNQNLDTARDLLRGTAAFFVASGGAAPAAELAVLAHESSTRAPARSMSPLRFIETVAGPNDAVLVLLSARARHPDTEAAAAHARNRGMRTVLITQRKRSDLTGVLQYSDVVMTVPAIRAKDGFLATQSVLAMAAVVCDLYQQPIPAAYTPLAGTFNVGTSGPLIVVHGRDGVPAATDVEVRFHELGLRPVELTDYRNFAHGRHVGLHRRRETATILALTTPSTNALATRTLNALPDDVRTVRLDATTDGAAGALELLGAVMALPAKTAAFQQIAPNAPRVPPFGRQLYHLPLKRLYAARSDGPVEQKLSAIGATTSQARATVHEAYKRWRASVLRQRLNALVLDYDGTVVTTAGRYLLPDPAVQASLLDVLSAGLHVAFATGRGDSLIGDLRQWVPKELHSQVSLGLHNGAWSTNLRNPSPEPPGDADWLDELRKRLEPYERAGVLQMRVGRTQLSVTSTSLEAPVSKIRDVVAAAAAPLSAQVRIASSGHSVDVIDGRFGKERFLAEVQASVGTALAIGDQGAVGGNDFQLLNATTLSVSVDRASASLDRCWNLAPASLRGPDALQHTMQLLQWTPSGVRLRPRIGDNR